MIESKKIELEALLKALSEEKDQSLLKIDSTFESHVHTLNRRATLLKNKVIDIYKGHVEKLKWGLDQTSWAMTCIVSLKEYHEKDISRGYFKDIDVGIYELNEVFKNISERVKPMENHIVFDDKHGIEKFRGAAKDLGRVQYSRPNIPRAEPEGGDPSVVPPDEPVTPTNDSASPMIGAVGGQEEPYPSLISALNLNNEHSISPDMKRKPLTLHSMSCDPEVLKRELSLPAYSSDPDNNGNPSAANPPPLLALSISTDKNSNSVAATGAVRPKSLDTKGKRGGPNIVRPVKGQRSGNTPPGKASVVSGEADEDDDPGGAAASVHPPQPVIRKPPVDPDIERLKKDKMYHHLVYTSYDEEELLKELKNKKDGHK